MVWFEVEAKVKIPLSEINSIKEKIKKIATLEKKETKTDEYFAIIKNQNYPKKAFRIRKTNGQFEINFKKLRKELSDKKIVVKEEYEFKIKNTDELNNLLELFKDLGFKKWLTKIKENETYKYKKDKKTSIEINKVKDLGYFIEIENLCQKKEIKKAKEKVKEILKFLNLSEANNIGYTKMLWKNYCSTRQ